MHRFFLRNFASETSSQAAVVLEVLFPATWPQNLCLNGHDAFKDALMNKGLQRFHVQNC